MSEKENDTPEPEEDGPIELPPGASCKTCAYSFTTPVESQGLIAGATSKREARFCRRFPPSAMVMPNQQGLALVGQPPPVGDDYVCYEYDTAVLSLTGGLG